jgi:hypothetical protein
VVFSEPKDDSAWATRAMLSEEMWIAERPLDRAMAVNAAASTFGIGGVWASFKRKLLPTALSGNPAHGVVARGLQPPDHDLCEDAIPDYHCSCATHGEK